MTTNFHLNPCLKSAAKAITWRLVGAADTFLLGFLVTGKFGAAGAIVGFELFTKSALYYGHERAWDSPLLIRVIARGRRS